jgi:hypothetical protein
MRREKLSTKKMTAVLDDRAAVDDLRQYFALGQPDTFTGSHFETLGGGGSRTSCRDTVTAEDLIAVELLSVRVPAWVAIDLLEGDLGRAVNEELRRLPTDVDLGDDRAAEYIQKDGPADRAWRSLEKPYQMGWVTAGKLLARKRPRLIPLYDGTVSCAFGTGRNFWTWLHQQLRADDFAVTRALSRLRETAGIPSAVSDIRVLDVVLWMRHRVQHTRSGCPGLR